MSYCLVACHKLYCVVSEIRLRPSQKQDFTSQQVEWCPNENWKITKPSEKIYQTFGPVSFKSYQTNRILTRHCLSDWHKVALWGGQCSPPPPRARKLLECSFLIKFWIFSTQYAKEYFILSEF